MAINATPVFTVTPHIRWLMGIVLCAIFGQVQALTTWTVMSTASGGVAGDCPGANCTLKAALSAAGSNGDTDQQIVFDAGIQGGTITDNFSIAFAKTLTIDGGGGGGMVLDGGQNGSVIDINNAAAVITLNHLTIQNGLRSIGAGITLFSGTGILDNSLVIGNTATNLGGGIYLSSSAFLTINNSTISGNITTNFGGGIANYGTLTISHSTIADNTADSGGSGVLMNGNTLTLISTIIAGNHMVGCCGPDFYRYNGTVTSLGHNLIGDGTGSSLVNGVNGDQIGSSGAVIDALFASAGLADNGGPTQTIALQSGSPAFGAGDCSNAATDQRGYSRPATLCDVGAFEETLFRGNFE